ncbi:MAG: hypothetical protein JJU37_14760 [Balneolaceae bacterium]|nr:hypothetical protein [Balneolaceae bacterium]
MKNLIQTVLFSLMAATLLGCAEVRTDQPANRNAETRAISYGSDLCAFTGKTIDVVRYGGQIIMQDGTEHKFMSVECVAGFYLGIEDKSQIKSMKIVDFAEGYQLLPVDELVYLHSTLRPSPNGMFLTAVDASNQKMKNYIYDAYPGPYLAWEEVLELVQNEWDLTGQTALKN